MKKLDNLTKKIVLSGVIILAVFVLLCAWMVYEFGNNLYQ